jgi:hypothetical protein
MTDIHVPHVSKRIAYHMDWDFREKALVGDGNGVLRPNFHPIGGELKHWLLRTGQLRIISSQQSKSVPLFTNPYVYNASALAIAYAEIVNDCADFADGIAPLDSMTTQVKFMRLRTESILYPARLCEAFFKQLLYLTSFPEKYYRGVSLGRLLSKDCSGCRNSNKAPHELSLIGSLAHRYRLCYEFEDCLKSLVTITNRRRDLEAAHSDIPGFSRKSSARLRKDFGKEFISHAKLFRHLLEHLSDIEDRMFSELCAKIDSN